MFAALDTLKTYIFLTIEIILCAAHNAMYNGYVFPGCLYLICTLILKCLSDSHFDFDWDETRVISYMCDCIIAQPAENIIVNEFDIKRVTNHSMLLCNNFAVQRCIAQIILTPSAKRKHNKAWGRWVKITLLIFIFELIMSSKKHSNVCTVASRQITHQTTPLVV